MAEYITHEHDVLIIGAGGAGLRAAVEASSTGVKVAVITKSLLGKAHTVMAEGGIAAAQGCSCHAAVTSPCRSYFLRRRAALAKGHRGG